MVCSFLLLKDSMKNLVLTLGLSTLGLTLSGCNPAEFKMYDDHSAGVVAQGTPVAVCDAFNANNIVSPVSGLKCSLYFLKDTDARVSSSTDLVRTGTRVNADLFMNNVNVPTRIFSTGFATDSGDAVVNENGDTLVEWFALSVKSNIRLGPNDAAGEYQLAMISDDGSTVSTQNASGVMTPVVENENAHATKMACATTTLTMTAQTRLPMSLTYFQGPREHIALIMMWRKVRDSNSATLQESECGAEGNDYFFDAGTASAAATPKTPYQNLLARGWKPLSTQNFELQSGSNRCNAPI
jgi:hypothetical protein